MITILDAGISNIGSLQNMLKKIGEKVIVTRDIEVLSKAERLILPGVGAFDAGIQRLHDAGVIDTLNDLAYRRAIPILGICLGMHLMCRSSEEGTLKGLGFFDADVKKINTGNTLKVPHMGWNNTHPCNDHPLMHSDDKMRFYYVHSFHPHCDHQGDRIATARYGQDLTVGLAKDNLMAVQFHPEKSHRFGMRLLSNFAKI